MSTVFELMDILRKVEVGDVVWCQNRGTNRWYRSDCPWPLLPQDEISHSAVPTEARLLTRVADLETKMSQNAGIAKEARARSDRLLKALARTMPRPDRVTLGVTTDEDCYGFGTSEGISATDPRWCVFDREGDWPAFVDGLTRSEALLLVATHGGMHESEWAVGPQGDF